MQQSALFSGWIAYAGITIPSWSLCIVASWKSSCPSMGKESDTHYPPQGQYLRNFGFC